MPSSDLHLKSPQFAGVGRTLAYPQCLDATTANPPANAQACRGGTLFHHTRYADMKNGDTWYVTFGPHKTDETADSRTRSTRTFKSEIDAKLFAMQILSKGWTASAGTLNPHQPKRVVGPSQIEQWADPGLGG
jgi:hypothetical protein